MKKLISLIWISVLVSACSSHDFEKVFVVHAGKHAMINIPVFVDLEFTGINPNDPFCLHSAHETVPGQIEMLSGSVKRIWWIVNLEAGESASYGLRKGNHCNAPQYSWGKAGLHSTRLLYNGQPVIQYEHPVFDHDDIEGTKRQFYHVFEPSGDQFISKGPGGQFPHHRGIFFGYNHVFIDDERINIWASTNGERSEHDEFIREFAGPVMGGHEVRIFWKDQNNRPFIEETLIVRAFMTYTGLTLVDYHSTLRATDRPVRLEGDRQHAGVQFRAAQFVADNPDRTKFIRPAGWSHVPPDSEIGEADMYDLPWNAMHFTIDGKPFTVSYMSHPANPGNAEMSERLYGRFGEFFPWYLTADNPLEVNYRFWIREGHEPSVEELEMHYQVYSNPSPVQVK